MKSLKNFLGILFGGAFLVVALTSCENFMNGAQVQNEIQEAIAYNNAKNISVLIQQTIGTGTTIPNGRTSVKQGYFFEISFTEASGSCFDQWIAVSQVDSKPVTDGVVFEDPKSSKTKVKIINDTIPITIIPKCLERIATDGEPTPNYASNGVYRDSTILVRFKQNLDPQSFIFSENEIPQNAQTKKTDGKIWAYVFNDQTYFKNISITSQEGYSIAQYFTQPKITGSVLTIQTDKTKQIPLNANETLKTVNVTISGNIRDNINKITMGQDVSWKYLINDSTEQKVTVTLTENNGKGTIEPAGNNQFSIGQILNISFEPNTSHQFIKWLYDENKIYIENPNSKQTKAIILSSNSNSTATTLDALCALRPSVSIFEPNTTENPVGKNSAITLTFNHSLPTDDKYKATLNNFLITVGGTPVNTSFLTPYVDTTDNKIVRFPANPNNIIEVPDGQTKTVSVYIPADFYYPLEDGTKVTLGGNGQTHNYRIDSTTVEKAYVTATSKTSGSGQMSDPTDSDGYSMEQTIAISFTVNEGFNFEHWIAKSQNLPEGEDISDYVVFADETKPNTTITFKKPLQGIVIEAVCPHLPEFDFKLTGSNGKFSPSKGIQTCTQTYTYPLSYEPDSDYEFLRWEIYDTETGNIIPDNTYIKIGNLKENETTYSFVSKPQDSIKLALRPVIAERPQIISYSPLFDVAGVNTDTSIRVIFDYDMDEASIYYTQDEIDEMIANGEADEGACKEGDVYYGYKKNGQLYYKNIILKNNDGGSNVNENYNHPVFENSKALIISAKRGHLLPAYTQVLVTLNKNISYKKDDVNIAMASSKKWIFQLKEGEDDEAPTIATGTFKLGFSNSASDILSTYTKDLTTSASTPWSDDKVKYNNDKKLYINLTAKDSGSGLSDYFTLVTKKIYDNKYDLLETPEEIKKLCYYQAINQTTKESIFEKTVDLSDYDDGVYSAYLEIKDITGNTLTYPKEGEGYYYFAIDKTAPELVNNPVIEVDSTKDNQINLNWNATKDSKTIVEYKNENEENWTALAETTGSSASIPDLATGKKYNIRFSLKDYNNNSLTSQTYSKDLEFGTVKNIKVDSYTNDTITLSWDAPDDTNCTGYEITMSQWISGPEYITQIFNISGKDKTTITLPIPERSKIDSNSTKSEFYTAQVLGYLKSLNFTIKAKYDSKFSKSTAFDTYSGFIPKITCTATINNYKFSIQVFQWRIDNFENFTHKITLYYKDNPSDSYKELDSYTDYNSLLEISRQNRETNRYFKLTWTFTNPQTKEITTRDSVLFKWDASLKDLYPYTE